MINCVYWKLSLVDQNTNATANVGSVEVIHRVSIALSMALNVLWMRWRICVGSLP